VVRAYLGQEAEEEGLIDVTAGSGV
jgi:hypothetical protein